MGRILEKQHSGQYGANSAGMIKTQFRIKDGKGKERAELSSNSCGLLLLDDGFVGSDFAVADKDNPVGMLSDVVFVRD
jgi:hypothetical protein